MTVHTIFVPEGWTVEQVWEVIRLGGRVLPVTRKGRWVNVDENGQEVRPGA